MEREATDAEIKAEIDALSHEQMATLWRFAPSGHKYFAVNGRYWPVFKEKWNSLGGMTTKLSKKIGWVA